jgi:predicted polyphosphate/ATP-dependent NAD kinase
MAKSLGLIVNPIAGMGGKVGLKGTDGEDTLKKAISLGAKKETPNKVKKVLKYIRENIDGIDIITCPAEMGEKECMELGIAPIVIGNISGGKTTYNDTEKAALKMMEEKVDLILFAGGDGTARNIYNSIGDKIPVIGIPTGVKIHSAVFATNPLNAGKVVENFFKNGNIEIRESEVMDIDEEQFRKGKVVAKLFGYMKVPYIQEYVQSLKAGGIYSDNVCLEGIADYVIDEMERDYIYLIGSGTTTRKILERMSLPYTLLGIDVVKENRLIAKDANEETILKILRDKKFKIVVSPIGGQGYIFGRGNQQLSPKVIKAAGKENIIIISTPSKLINLKGRPLLVDTGDEKIDRMLKGYYRVIVGYDETYVYKCSY